MKGHAMERVIIAQLAHPVHQDCSHASCDVRLFFHVRGNGGIMLSIFQVLQVSFQRVIAQILLLVHINHPCGRYSLLLRSLRLWHRGRHDIHLRSPLPRKLKGISQSPKQRTELVGKSVVPLLSLPSSIPGSFMAIFPSIDLDLITREREKARAFER